MTLLHRRLSSPKVVYSSSRAFLWANAKARCKDLASPLRTIGGRLLLKLRRQHSVNIRHVARDFDRRPPGSHGLGHRCELGKHEPCQHLALESEEHKAFFGAALLRPIIPGV